MADNLNTKFPEYIVEFPNVKVPGEYKVEDFSDYMPVDHFTPAGHHSVEGPHRSARSDGLLPVQAPDPVCIRLYPKLMPLVNPLCGVGLLEDKKIKCIQLARNSAKGHTESFEMELEGVALEKQGDTVVVLYQKFTDKSYNGKKAPYTGGYDFIKQEKLD